MMKVEVILIVFVLATYSASKTVEWNNFLVFMRELVLSQKWHPVTIVNCNNNLDLVQKWVQWQKKLDSNVYMQQLSEDEVPVLLQNSSSVTRIIILVPCNFTSRIYTKISTASDIKLVIFKKDDQEAMGKIYIYANQNDNTLHNEHIASWVYQPNLTSYWSSFHNTNFSSQIDKLYSRSSLNDTTLRIGVLVGKPDYSYDCGVHQDKLGHVVGLSGYSSLLLQVLQGILHFKVTYVASDTWGLQDNKGEWVGLIGLLVENKADIAICSPTITAERTSAVRFLHPTQYSRRTLIYRATALPLTQDVFLLTFTGSLWLVCVLIALALLAGFLHFTSYCSSKYQPERPWTWVEVTLWAVAATCQQGFTKEPLGVSSRTVFLVGYLTCYLLYTWFAAGVTSLLAVQGKGTHLQLEDVVQLRADFSAFWDGLLSDYFMNSKDNTASTLYTTQLTKEYNKVHNLGTLFSQLRKGSRVAMATEDPVKHFMSTKLSTDEACQLTLSPLLATKHMKGWAVHKNFSYFNLFNYWLLRMHETGVYQVALRRSIGMLPACGSGPGYSSAGMGHVMSAMCILAAGTILALLILFLEIIWHCYKHH